MATRINAKVAWYRNQCNKMSKQTAKTALKMAK